MRWLIYEIHYDTTAPPRLSLHPPRLFFSLPHLVSAALAFACGGRASSPFRWWQGLGTHHLLPRFTLHSLLCWSRRREYLAESEWKESWCSSRPTGQLRDHGGLDCFVYGEQRPELLCGVRRETRTPRELHQHLIFSISGGGGVVRRCDVRQTEQRARERRIDGRCASAAGLG